MLTSEDRPPASEAARTRTAASLAQRWWNSGEPGQRTWVARHERCEAPVENGRHVACGSEVASGGGCQQVAGSGCFSVSAASVSSWARRVGQPGLVVSPGRYSSAWSSSATVWVRRVVLPAMLSDEELRAT
jgi:hypothetical protein